jgi:polyisoprenoid-binding protein YceI
LTYQHFKSIVDISTNGSREVAMPDRTVSVLRTHDDRLIPVAGVYDIDGAHTSVEFVGRHLMITKVRGRFSDVRGTVTIADEPESSHVEVEIGAGSLSSGNDDRDNHLKSADFFDVDQYPTITFRSTAVRARRDHTWELSGELTVRDVTRPVTLQVDFDGADVSPMGDERIGFSAATDINREDFGLTWNMTLETGGLLVGKTARIELSVQAVAKSHAAVS